MTIYTNRGPKYLTPTKNLLVIESGPIAIGIALRSFHTWQNGYFRHVTRIWLPFIVIEYYILHKTLK